MHTIYMFPLLLQMIQYSTSQYYTTGFPKEWISI